jgi:hypothetical protein
MILAGGALNCNHHKESATGEGPHGRCATEESINGVMILTKIAACCYSAANDAMGQKRRAAHPLITGPPDCCVK